MTNKDFNFIHFKKEIFNKENNILKDSKVNKKMIKYWDYLREYKKLKREILNSVNKVFKSGTLFFGQELIKFEKNFCKFNNSKY